MASFLLFAISLSFQGDPRFPEDACLRTVASTPAAIWVAGDEGTLLVSKDKGKTWEKIPLGVNGAFLKIYFQDERRGWLVGREENPGGSSGLLFFTRDGGKTWTRGLPGMLPPLHGVLFDPSPDSQLGILWGESSPLQPSGLFQTNDGGKSWQPVPGNSESGGWRAARWERDKAEGPDAEKQPAGRLVLAGMDGSLGEWRSGSLKKVDLDLRSGTAGVMALAGAHAFGSRGLHLEKKKNGWQAARLPMSRDAGMQCQWRAAAEAGGRILATGFPGSCVLLGGEGDQLELVRTGQKATLHGVCWGEGGEAFCVGELGRVLRSNDGGKSWEVCRGQGNEIAVAEWVANESGHAWTTIAKLGAVDGWRVSVTRVLPPQVNIPAAHGRFLQAVRQGGAAWTESWEDSPPPDVDLAGEVGDIHGLLTNQMPELEARMVLALRIQRPRLVLVPGNQGGALSGLEQAISRSVLNAVRMASDPKAFPEHMRELGLEPWSVSRFLARVAPRQDAYGRVDTQELQDCLEDSLEDWTAQVRLVSGMGAAWEKGEPVECWNLIYPPGVTGKKVHTLMDGLEVIGAGLQRARNLTEQPDPDAVKALRLRNQLRSLAMAPTSSLNDPQKLEAALLPSLEKLPDHQAAVLLSRLAGNYSRRGDWVQARELHRLLVNKYPASPLVPSSCRWLIAYGASGEARRRHELTQKVERGIIQVGTPVATNSSTREPGKPPKPSTEFAEQFQKETAYLNDKAQSRQWLEECLTLGNLLSAHGSQVADDPLIQFSLQSARRQLGRVQENKAVNQGLLGIGATEKNQPPAGTLEGEARAYHRRLANALPGDSPWRSAAALEMWITERQGECPRPLMACKKAMVRPYLDGKLDDPIWQGAFRSLRGGKAEEQAQFAVGYDSEFLYLAAICPSPHAGAVEPLGTRTRDSASLKRDRICWYLDIDRDYATGYRFVVDQAGGVSEGCWMDSGWDPRWFVKVGQGEGNWTVEAAIPLALLSSSPPTPNQTWLLQCTRARPGKALQGWVGTPDPPEMTPRPESQGALMFLPELPAREKP